jgi:NADPH:quinone reductase-like Zn-dependent oxidoreductase
LVRIEASGINPSDVGSVQGRFHESPLPRIVGRDFAGVVVKGAEALIGRKVWGSGGDLGILRDGTHAEFVCLPEGAAVPRPKNLSAEQCAVIGVPYVTAYEAVISSGLVEPDQWVVVSGATGSVGQAALEIAGAFQARLVALVRGAEAKEKLASRKIHEVVRVDEPGWIGAIREATNGDGADLALNGVGSTLVQGLLDSLKNGGRQVVYSIAGGREAPVDLLSFYRRRLSLIGLNTVALDSVACGRILGKLTPLFESGTLRPLPVDGVYSIDQAAQAFERTASGDGKVVLSFSNPPG